MRNGGYFFSDFRGVSLVNQYYNIYANMRNKNQCVFAESIGGSDDEVLDTAYAKACPWDETAAEVEYWKDENGEIITNTYGDKVIKHYYEIKDKERPVDENGNPIPIPINREGFEEKDEDFELHYEAGFYRTGKLELPEGYEPPETEEESSEEVTEEETENE